MKYVALITLMMAFSALKAQVIIDKNYLEIYCRDSAKNYILVNETNENIVISVKLTTSGFRLALQRNGLAKNMTLFFNKNYKSIPEGSVYLLDETGESLIKIDKRKMLMYFENYGLGLKLTCEEREKLLNYLNIA